MVTDIGRIKRQRGGAKPKRSTVTGYQAGKGKLAPLLIAETDEELLAMAQKSGARARRRQTPPLASLIKEAQHLGSGGGPGICPCCGQGVKASEFYVSLDTNRASRWGRTVRLSPQEAEILWMIWSSYPGTTRRGKLIAGLVGALDMPDDPDNILYVKLHQLRWLIAKLGVSIETHNSHGYQIILHDRAVSMGRGPRPKWLVLRRV